MSGGKKERTGTSKILLSGFADPGRAQQVRKEIDEAQALVDFAVLAEATVGRDDDGQIHLYQHGYGGEGAILGASGAAVLGALAGPAGLLVMAVAGGVFGGIAGHLLGGGISKEHLEEIGEALPPGSSAYLLLVDDVDHEDVYIFMQGYDPAKVISLTVAKSLSDQVSTQLEGDA